MNKLYSLLIAMTLAFSVSCFLQDEEDEAAPVGSGTLKITATYDDGASTTIDFGNKDGTKPGSAKNYIYLYETLGTRSDTPMPKYSGSSSTNGTDIYITDIVPGSYYVAICYDYKSSTDEPQLSSTDPYELYDGASGAGTPLVSEAVKVEIKNGETTSITMSFNDQWRLGVGMSEGRAFLTSK